MGNQIICNQVQNDIQDDTTDSHPLDFKTNYRKINLDDFTRTDSSNSTNVERINMDNFEILRCIGKGAQGKVMLVQKKDSQQDFAMKVFNKSDFKTKSQMTQLKEENNIMKSVDHPFVSKLHYAFQTQQKLFLVQDYLQGGELYFHIQKNKFTEEKAKFYAAEIILALEHLHKNNIVYRDMKPENILLGADGHIKLVDFGLSKASLKCQTFCGTPEYIAPEIIMEMPYSKGVDFWALGVLIYEMVYGKVPYQHENVFKIYKNTLSNPIKCPGSISDELKALLESLLTIDPSKRLQDVNEIKNHKFFSDINWEQVENKQITPPFIPKLKNSTDMTYFDNKLKKEEICSDDDGEEEQYYLKDFSFDRTTTLGDALSDL